MNDLMAILGELFDRTFKRRPVLYKLIVVLGFTLVIGLFVRDMAGTGASE